ncbi:MAG: aminoglycoside phosphotransferase family protein [Bacteroidales bacterium]|jgi:Ser/Thr protein kinase RdoA (MazF antagonist)|nr:aminoglycoside phosphotransferase family protein [Bacteroidales bacterium]MDX9926036.1 aminoglycoside phosphotransferase family protein [Bacteroidales bacterium]HNX83110.1 aminoglycoside phosphotransferase family protein [Bacteroidales bacterium]HOC48330.1 aminoglycoside phosphotransferase family protein [Bacteroidales bacterium]HPS98076.1 aminoglycoside phosphotransferase family protein [Bacteroidales bacterium]
METDLKSIFSRFRGEGTFLEGKSFGPGHIHDTFRIITAEPECDNYIIQRLNSNVFRDIPNLQENMERVTGHLRNKIAAMPGSDPKRECLTLVPDRETGRSFITDADGRYWRMFVFIEDHRSYEKVDSAHKAFEGGRIIGRFQAMLADLPGEPLHETIPDFHNIARRLDAFHRVISRDPAGRVAAVRSEIEEITSREEEMKTIIRLGAAGKIPLRITHNDTKFNNILFDKNDRALLIIDLDTVMPGYIHYDFGDAIRTAANRTEEDAEDLSAVSMDINIYQAYAEGFLSETRNTLNATEIEYLPFAPKLLTYIMATRFLTDFIDGDNYYKTRHPLHNLQRVRTQITLLRDMEARYDNMVQIIKNITK